MHEWIDTVVSNLADKGWALLPQVLPRSFCLELNTWIDQQVASGAFQHAGIGKGQRHQKNDSVRSDLVLWMPDLNEDQRLRPLETLLDNLRHQLNRDLFAGLETFEGHFAIYPPGGFYRRHVDTFRDDDARKLTFLLYLNERWEKADGGELILEMTDHSAVTVAPTMGTVVMFDSRRFPHEVTEANAERRSFTGWFKVRSLS
jgi:SM-20-related protein